MPKLEGYRKIYRLRTAIPGRKSIEVTFPYEVVEREARARGLSLEQFLQQYHAVAEYNNFEGVLYTFEERPSEEEPTAIPVES